MRSFDVRNALEAKLNNFVADRDYGPVLKEIAVIPMILRPEWQAGHREATALPAEAADCGLSNLDRFREDAG